MRAARHTIVLISLRRGQHSWRLPWSCCNPLLYVCSAPCKCNPSKPSPRRQRSVWADRCSASEHQRQPSCRQGECFRLHDCIVGRSLHARLQRRCSTAGRQVEGTRCHVAGLLCRTCSQAMARRSSSASPTHARAGVKLLYAVAALPISKVDTL